jgi:hypothetical protein
MILAGLDDVPWHDMNHAYGPATEVPAILRGLVDDDPAAREVALDAMYGAVHHQGDVYDCTVAAVPFLIRIAVARDQPGRADIIELLASIGGIDRDLPHDKQEDDEQEVDGDDEREDHEQEDDEREDDDVEEDPGERGAADQSRRAANLIAAEYQTWLDLLADPDHRIRVATVGLLPVIRRRAGATIDRLRRLFQTEPVPAVRAAIVATVSRLGRARQRDEIGDWFSALLTAEPDVLVRLAVLTELAAVAGPDRPGVDVGTALALLEAGYALPDEPVEPAGFTTDTLIGSVRQLFEASGAGRNRQPMEPLLRAVAASFGDRVDRRRELLAAALRSGHWECRFDALFPASNLIVGWRGDYEPLVRLIGERLGEGRPGFRARATHVLSTIGRLALPAADALAAALTDTDRVAPYSTMDRQSPWVVQWASGPPTIGPALATLAATGDARALPMLAWALDQDPLPRDVGTHIGRLGPAAGELVPLIKVRLAEPAEAERNNLVVALRGIGPRGVEALPEVLALAPSPWIVAAIGQWGRSATAALPWLAAYVEHANRQLAVAAVLARWRIDADTDAAATAISRLLDGEHDYDTANAARAIAEIGAATPDATARLHDIARHDSTSVWLAVAAAHAHWRLTGDTSAGPVLARAWLASHPVRPGVARAWADLGAAAADAAPLLAAEREDVRRLDSRTPGHMSSAVDDDLDFLDLVDRAARLVTAGSRTSTGLARP